MTKMAAPASAGMGDVRGPIHHPHVRRYRRRSRSVVARAIGFFFVLLPSHFCIFPLRTELLHTSPSFAEAGFAHSHVHRRHAGPDASAFARTAMTTTAGTFSTFSAAPATTRTRVGGTARTGAKMRDDAAGDDEVQTLEFTMPKHKPLGCTVEESLAARTSDAALLGSAGEKPPVFVTKLVEGGNAAEAGIQVGDVLVGLTGVFDDVLDVSGVGIEKIRALVAGRRPDEPLVLRVIRGTDVMERHEDALVDLCTLPGGTDDTLDACVDAIMSSDDISDLVAPLQECRENDDAECLVDDLYKMWGEDLPPPPPLVDGDGGGDSVNGANGDAVGEDGGAPRKEVAPWSSRSSPSGTYARNPATGKLERID